MLRIDSLLATAQASLGTLVLEHLLDVMHLGSPVQS
jgi:hypothetical protein